MTYLLHLSVFRQNMNHILRLQPTYSVLKEFVNNSLDSQRKYYFCGHCLQRHIFANNNVRELSTYVSALRLLLKKKQNLQKTENETSNKIPIRSVNCPSRKKLRNKYTELVKVTKYKSIKTKMTITQLKPSDVKFFAEEPGMFFGKLDYKNKYNYDSTMSYDSNYLFPKENITEHIENFVQSIIDSSKVLPKKNKTKSMPKPKNKKYVKLKINKKNCEKSKIKKKSYELNILKALPLSSVEVFPMPRSLQLNISKKSAKAIQNLTEPDIEKKKDKLNLNNLLPLVDGKVKDLESEKTIEDKDRETPEFFQNILIDVSTREYSVMQLVQSYIDVAVNIGMLDEALIMVNDCRKKKIWKTDLHNNFVLDIYNILLHSYSVRGNWSVINKITFWMKSDGVKFNSQTYAAILDCLGRVDSQVFQTQDQWKEEVVKVLKSLYKDKLSLNELFSRTILTKDKHEVILQTIRKILPCFDIEPIKIQLSSDCSLLKNLYTGNSKIEAQVGNDITIETMEAFVEEQMLLEKNFSVQIKSVATKKVFDCQNKDKKKLDALKENWRKMIHQGFVRRLKKAQIEHAKLSPDVTLYVYLNSLPVDWFVDVMINTVQNLIEYSGSFCPKTSILYNSIGDKIYYRYQIKKKMDTAVLDTTEKLFKKYCSWYIDPVGPATNSRQEWQMLIQDFQEGCPIDVKEIKWPSSVKSALGKFLYDIILQEVKINVGGKNGSPSQLIPVFYLITRYDKMKCNEEIKCHPTITRLFNKGGFEHLNFDADQIPMVCPPKPWKTVNHGGYLILPTRYIRQPQETVGKMTNFKKVPVQKLFSTFDSLNALQSVPWMINESVLDVALEVFQNGGCDKLNVPELPDSDPIPLNIPPEMTTEEKKEEYKKRQKLVMEKQNQYGLWCEALYRLSLANHFRKRIFWFPQNFDFRGRVYPVPPHLNHLGADLFRSLLLFGKCKPLGPKGLDWIKIHTINLTGTHKKRSVKERLEYANAILPEILDSAEKPLTGNRWWTQSDEPWQTLAACFEIKNILSSPCPELYVSNFPIHQDGSCNGLQHYAALGRDTIGAKSVNLAPSELPQDVYSVVTQIIEEKRTKDAEDGIEIAKILEGFISRKVVKQTIMTTVYGVTRYGARLQIAGQLEDIEEFPNEHVWTAAGYLTGKTFESLQQMFTSAKEIQDWFIQCAITICKKKDYVQWVSPIGLPIVQPYAKVLSKNQEAKYKCKRLPNVMKQKNAFPPNFIHSLDSCHMMLTALFCEQRGMTFASIHDCFWTHPCTVDAMNKICREQFVSLHSQPILEDLAKFFTQCYSSFSSEEEKKEALKIFNSVPTTGDFDLSSVMNSQYFFS